MILRNVKINGSRFYWGQEGMREGLLGAAYVLILGSGYIRMFALLLS